jgi:hypothetical protein
MAEIKTQEDWWKTVDDGWEYFMDIVFHHLDPNFPAYEVPGNATSKPTGRKLVDELSWLKEHRDWERLYCYFQASWGMASEAYAWSVPYWGSLCDLCSETWVFQEESE